MTTATAHNVTGIEPAATARWLARALEPARRDVRTGPTAEAVDRIRARVFGEALSAKPPRRIAA